MAAMPSHSPHASRPSTFRAPGWGAPALLSSCCRWRSATSRKLVPFSHRLASRIFIRQPGCFPSPMVTQDGDHQYGPVGHLLLQHSGERALAGLAEGADFDNAGPISRKRRQLQHAWFAGSAGSGAASGATSHRWAECGYLPTVRAAVAPCALGDRPRRRALLGRRSCSWAVLPLRRYDASARRSMLACPGGPEWGSAGGQMAAVVGAEVVAAE
jgi:hypothetical protein